MCVLSRATLLYWGTVAALFGNSYLAGAGNSLPPSPVTRVELTEEIQEKLQRVHQLLLQQNLAGVLLSRVDNFSWLTAGIADNHIVITSEIGAASLLIMRDGRKFVVANNSEMPRLLQEDLSGLGYEAKQYAWYEEQIGVLRAIHEAVGNQPIGTDVPSKSFRLISNEIASLRYQLTPSEIKKYRWAGQAASEAVSTVCRNLKQGVSERETEANASEEIMRRGLRPTVLLIGFDHRVYDFHHHTPTDAKLARYAIVNVCARRWGLVVSVARFVHFGPPDPELKRRLQAAMLISAKYEANSKPGVAAGQMIDWAKGWFQEAGYAGWWHDHHQGGAIGYAERDWLAVPGSTQVIHERQAFAWNPILRGALSFDTIIVFQGPYRESNQNP